MRSTGCDALACVSVCMACVWRKCQSDSRLEGCMKNAASELSATVNKPPSISFTNTYSHRALCGFSKYLAQQVYVCVRVHVGDCLYPSMHCLCVSKSLCVSFICCYFEMLLH